MLQGLDHSVPSTLKSTNPFFQLFILALPFPVLRSPLGVLGCTQYREDLRGGDHARVRQKRNEVRRWDIGGWRRRDGGEAGAETAVLLFELGHTALEPAKLRLSTVTAVLGCDAVAVCTGLFAFLGGHFGAGPFAGWLVGKGRGGCGGRG